MNPSKVLLFVCAVFASLALIMVAMPSEGIKITPNFTLRFVHFSDLLSDTSDVVDISKVENIKRDEIWLKDSLSLADSLKIFSDDGRDSTRIKYPNNDKKILDPIFAELDHLKESKDRVTRIIHYGDSQIEGDRISGYLRDRLQELFGGTGPGLVPAVQPIPARSVFQSCSENWTRNAVFGMIEQKADHNRYGAMLSVCTYSGNQAHVKFNKSNIGYPRNKDIKKITVWYGNSTEEVTVEIYGEKMTLPASDKVNSVSFKPSKLEDSFTLNFSGPSPEIYGISLDGGHGIAVDNVPMRGSSGTRFTMVHKPNISQMHKAMNVKLILMEFGGNMMPSIQGEKSIKKYGEEFYRQLMYMKEINPDACIITVGLADMSKRINGKMQSYEYIEEVRDELKNASFKAGCAYWDMYSAMGGKNSMPAWVNAKPALAGPDYIHFTPRGAEKIAELFTKSFINDYNEYRFRKKMEKLRSSDGHTEKPNPKPEQ